MTYYHRALEARVREALDVMPAVFLNGPRQAGKSTMVQHLSGAYLGAAYVTFDDITAYASAAQDPEGFLRRMRTPVILDEVQLVPALFRVLKRIIDERRAKDKARANGQFLLTGSANVLALPGLAEALVGRMAVLSLYPLSASEAFAKGKPAINGWFDQELPLGEKGGSRGRRVSFDDIIHRATFPEIAGASKAASRLWFDGYLTALLQRDVRQLADIENIPALPNIVKVLAARAGGLLNDADCARDAKLNPMTYRRYRMLLQQLFLTTLVPPWYRNIGKRLVKSPKLFFTDTALLCHQIGIDAASLRAQNPGLFGRVLENFVASELTKQLAAISDGTLYHFRTHDDREVDFVVERRNGKLLGVEVKGRESVGSEDFAALKILKEQVGGDFARGIVLYLGKDTIPFGDDLVAMPLESLWEFNVDITANKDIRRVPDLESYAFWANYGDATRIRCLMSKEAIADHFHDRASEKQAVAAIRRHWDVIWPIIVRKIADGQVEIGRHDKVRQVILETRDLGNSDFRAR